MFDTKQKINVWNIGNVVTKLFLKSFLYPKCMRHIRTSHKFCKHHSPPKNMNININMSTNAYMYMYVIKYAQIYLKIFLRKLNFKSLLLGQRVEINSWKHFESASALEPKISIKTLLVPTSDFLLKLFSL
jgi:hypothetical protein